MGRNRAEGREKRVRSPGRDLRTWRGFLLVSLVGSVLASLGAWWYTREADALTGGLFTGAELVLLAFAVYAFFRVRRLKRDASGSAPP